MNFEDQVVTTEEIYRTLLSLQKNMEGSYWLLTDYYGRGITVRRRLPPEEKDELDSEQPPAKMSKNTI